MTFIGGNLFGSFPTIAYSHLLKSFFEFGYTVIAIPIPFGFNHGSIAKKIVNESKRICSSLSYSDNIPHFWVGHSLGCKYIALLEAEGQIWNQPSLLIAPDISDTIDAIPIPIVGKAVANFLDRLQLGVIPNRRETLDLIHLSRLFNITAIISFSEDTVAGTRKSSPEKSDVSWLIQELSSRECESLLEEELLGKHLAPVGIRIGEKLFDLEIRNGVLSLTTQRELEPLAKKLLRFLYSKIDDTLDEVNDHSS